MAERVTKEKVDRDNGYLYYLGKDGYVWRTPMRNNPRGRKAKVGGEKVKRGRIPLLHRQERIRSKDKDEQKGKNVKKEEIIALVFLFSFFYFFLYFSADFKTSIYNARSPVCYLT